MKKYIIILLFFSIFVKAQQTQDAQLDALGFQIQEERERLRSTILSIQGGSEFLKALKNIKLQFSILSGELGVSFLFNQLSSMIDQECNFMNSDAPIKELIKRSAEINRQLEEYKKTPEFQKIQQLQKTVNIMYETPVLTYEQGQQAQALEDQIKTLASTKLSSLQEELKKIDAQIAQRLQAYTKYINELSIKIRSILQTNPKMVQLRNQISEFKNNPAFQKVAQSLKDSLENSLNALETLYEQEDALETACVMASPGFFTSGSNLFDLINQAAVELLIEDE